MITDEEADKAQSILTQYCQEHRGKWDEETPFDSDCESCIFYWKDGDEKDIKHRRYCAFKCWWLSDMSYSQEETKAPVRTDNDAVNHPYHYCQGGIETIDVIKAKISPERFRGFLQGNVIKYVTRAEFKGKQLEDLKKAAWYLDRLIQEMEGGE